jgi:molybdate transport system ATP-binding protein
MLDVDVRHRLGRFELAARFTADAGLTVLFGRSGAGKTSIVNVIAGLVRPLQGRVSIDGVALVDTERQVFVPAHRRRIGYVFQESRLFPHLSVRQNLLYGRWFTPRAERRERLDHVVELLGLGALLERRPGLLSGGERQRVAIGRALLASPRLLLLDEPLASLDAARKEEILPYIERLRDEIRLPVVYVSHAIAEVTRLATTMVLLSDGRVEAIGSVPEIMGRLDLTPMTGRFEAGAMLETRVAEHEDSDGLTRLQVGAADEEIIRTIRLDLPVGTPVRVRVRARDVILATARPTGLSALNILPGRVVEVAPSGDGPAVDVRLALSSGQTLLARVTKRSAVDLAIAPGRVVFAIIKTMAIDRRSLGRRADAAGGNATSLDPTDF